MVFRLEALGGLRLVAADGQVLQTQRRRLALLALLAAAGERGLTRDQVVGFLWPETTEDNARHALNQLLYSIRRSLSEGALRGVDPLRLDPAVLDSDVRRFEAALSAGEYDAAVAQYRGPFLHGFYLADASEFERWVERERARLAVAHADALDRLAAEAESRGDAPAAVTWRRKLAELDPLDARRATALMRALGAAGDSAGALAHSRTYEALVREELDAPPDPAVIALANEIRTHSERQAVVGAAPALTSPGGGTLTATHAPAPTASAPEVAEPELSSRAGGGDASHSSVAEPIGAARPRREPRVLVYGLAALALALASLGVRQLTRDRHGRTAVAATPGATQGPSIAVLPLRNLSADPADAALADGMSEELISTLSRMGGLRVTPSTSVYALEGQRMDVRQIAAKLRVAHVLEGSLQKVGRRLRLQLHLADARDGRTLWSQTYDRDLGDIFAVQDDISRAVTRELGSRIHPRRYTPSIEAYEWYLKGMDPTLTRSRAGTDQALAYLGRAIAADSSFAAAYAAVSRVYFCCRSAKDVGERPGENFALAEDAAERAVALDDSLAEAHAALGWARMARRNLPGAEAELRRALALDPRDARAHQGIARVYLWTGRPVEQLKAASLGVEIDPLSIEANRELALALAMNGRCDSVITLLAPLKTLTPPPGVVGVVRGQCYAAMHKWPEAIAELRWTTQTTDVGTALAFLGYALARAGQRDEAQRILSDLLAGRKYSHGAFGIATIYMGLGNFDEAFRWLEKAATEHSLRPYVMGPMFDELRRDPRFARVRWLAVGS